ncbi:hypothetical protein EBU99_06250 [bacterium]|nr:hypothetical protein [bacterium]
MSWEKNLAQVRTWIVSAWWPEQRDLAESMAQGEVVESVNESLTLVGGIGFLRTGVGTPRAAAVVSRALARAHAHGGHADALIFLATSGAYASDVPLESAWLISNARWSDGSLATGQSYLPGLDAGMETIAATLSAFSGADPEACALSTPGITLSTELAHSLAQKGRFENLEIFGVALAAQQFSIPWAAVLGVSNTVGPQAHDQWKSHHLKASLAAQKLLLKSYFEGQRS